MPLQLKRTLTQQIDAMPVEPIDAELQACLQQFAALDQSTPTPGLDYVQRRRLLSELQARYLRGAPLEGITSQQHYICAPGREIALRSYTPTQGSGRIWVWLHGGGWMVGSLDTHDDLCEHLATFTGHTVLSVHYRRTPENPFPAALEDVREVLRWLATVPDIQGRTHPQVLLGGDSAGGHLALASCLDALRSPDADAARVQGLLLFYPCLLPDANASSLQAFAQGYGLTAQAMQQYWQALGASEHPLRTPSLCSETLHMLPPTLVVSASHDILRDEAEDFVQQLQCLPQGPAVKGMRAIGMVHGFARMLQASRAARHAVQDACHAFEKLHLQV